MQSALQDCRILVVEDDPAIAQTIRSGLASRCPALRVAGSAEQALEQLAAFRPQLLVLDLNLPGMNGLELLERLRSQGESVPVLILTSRNEVEDRILGLRQGADDYLGKPFSVGELEARIEVLLRRGQGQEPMQRLQAGDLVVDREARSVSRAGEALHLTPREFELVLYLLRHVGRTVSREMLARDVWRETSRYTPINNVIDVQMTRLRQKLDDPYPKKLLHTVRGVGYSLREPGA